MTVFPLDNFWILNVDSLQKVFNVFFYCTQTGRINIDGKISSNSNPFKISAIAFSSGESILISKISMPRGRAELISFFNEFKSDKYS